jgi:hypothetical protein
METPTGDVYDLAPDPTTAASPRRKGPVPVALTYRPAAPPAPADANKADPETIRSLYMPLWLLGSGIVVEVTAALMRERNWAYGLTIVGVQVIAGTAVLLMGVLLAARLRRVALGSLPVAAMKLSAVMMAPAAVFTLLSAFLGDGLLGVLVGFAASFVLYFALLGAFFDLDESDTWYFVWVIFLVRLAVYFALAYGVLRWL